MRLLLLICAVLCSWTGTASAQSRIIPPIDVGGDITVQPYGWTWSTAGKDIDDALSMARVRVDIVTPSSLDGFIELDVTDGFGTDVNWLRQAYVSYEVDGNTTLRAGRLFLAAPLATPPPFLLKTASYGRYPFSAFAWGVQVVTRGEGWSFTADVTANSNTRFSQADSWNGLESSGRMNYSLSPELQVGGTYQVSEDNQRFGAELTWKPAANQTLNAVAYQTFGQRELTGGYVFYEYEVNRWFTPHVQLDYQTGAPEELLTTVGARFDYGQFRLAVGHEFAEGETTARLQIRF